MKRDPKPWDEMLPQEKAAYEAKLESLRKTQHEQFEVLKKHLPGLKILTAADPKDRTLKDILMDLKPSDRPQALRIAKALRLAKKKRKHMH